MTDQRRIVLLRRFFDRLFTHARPVSCDEMTGRERLECVRGHIDDAIFSLDRGDVDGFNHHLGSIFKINLEILDGVAERGGADALDRILETLGAPSVRPGPLEQGVEEGRSGVRWNTNPLLSVLPPRDRLPVPARPFGMCGIDENEFAIRGENIVEGVLDEASFVADPCLIPGGTAGVVGTVLRGPTGVVVTYDDPDQIGSAMRGPDFGTVLDKVDEESRDDFDD